MDNTHIILRYGEIFLKGKNRPTFENKLVNNIKKLVDIKKIIKLRSRYIIDYIDNHSQLKNVFGLTSYSPAVRVGKEENLIKEKVVDYVKGLKGTFKIVTKRSDKNFPIKSPEFNVLVGEHVEKQTKLEFSFENPKYLINIEINQDAAYIFNETFDCFGGLPTGVEGNVIILVENEASLLAGLLFMKRGVSIFPVAFEEKDISLLQKYSPQKLNLVVVKDFDEIDKFATDKNLDIVVSGQNFDNLQDYESDLLVMRPLIAFNDGQIEDKLEMYST